MKSIYIVFSHSFKPEVGSNGLKTGQWESMEQVEFVDRLRDKHLSEATAIIDYLSEKIVKCRPKDVTYEQMVEHATEKYPDQMEYLDKLILGMAEALDDEKIQERAEKVKQTETEETDETEEAEISE